MLTVRSIRYGNVVLTDIKLYVLCLLSQIVNSSWRHIELICPFQSYVCSSLHLFCSIKVLFIQCIFLFCLITLLIANSSYISKCKLFAIQCKLFFFYLAEGYDKSVFTVVQMHQAVMFTQPLSHVYRHYRHIHETE